MNFSVPGRTVSTQLMERRSRTLSPALRRPTPSLAIVDICRQDISRNPSASCPGRNGLREQRQLAEPQHSLFRLRDKSLHRIHSRTAQLAGDSAGATTGLIMVVDATTDTVAQTLAIPGLIANMVFNPNTQKFTFWSKPAPAPRRFLSYDAITLTQVRRDPQREYLSQHSRCKPRHQQNLRFPGSARRRSDCDRWFRRFRHRRGEPCPMLSEP